MGIRSFVCALAISSVTALTPLTASAQVTTTVTFYDTLSPYGDWVVVENYGRVWRPSRTVVGVDFVPYASGGHWVHSNVGWVFEPSWDWGWLPFHYGRWYMDPFNGWVWVPDNVWAPAWVEWRVGGGYIGWAPVGPRYHQHVRTNWYFVENRHFVEPEVWHHRAVAVNTETVFQATLPVAPPPGQAWAPGPRINEISAVSAMPVPERHVEGPPPRPMQMFPRDMPPAAPPPPSPMGMQKLPANEPSRQLQPVDRSPPAPTPGPQQPFGRDPMRAPPSPQPFQQDPLRSPARDPQPFQRQPAPMPRAPQPFERAPQPQPFQRDPQPFERAPQPMQRDPQTFQQPPQPMQRAPQPMQQAAPMQREPQRAPMQRDPQPFQQQPQPMQRAPQPMPQAAPMPQQQEQAPAPPRKQGPGPGQPFPPMGGGPQRGPPPGGPK